MRNEALAGNEPYDLILLSHHLSGTDGVQLSRFIRSLEHRTTTAVVMLTSSGEITDEAKAAGVDEVLIEPVNVSILIWAVNKHNKLSLNDSKAGRLVSFCANTYARNEDGTALKKRIVRRELHCPLRSCWGEPAEPGLTLAPSARPSISARVRWVFAVSRESCR